MRASEAEAVAEEIQAPCGCFARPGEEEGTVCMHDNVLTPWPSSPKEPVCKHCGYGIDVHDRYDYCPWFEGEADPQTQFETA